MVIIVNEPILAFSFRLNSSVLLQNASATIKTIHDKKNFRVTPQIVNKQATLYSVHITNCRLPNTTEDEDRLGVPVYITAMTE